MGVDSRELKFSVCLAIVHADSAKVLDGYPCGVCAMLFLRRALGICVVGGLFALLLAGGNGKEPPRSNLVFLGLPFGALHTIFKTELCICGMGAPSLN